MNEQSRVETMRALLAKHEDEGLGLDEKRRHTYIWDRSDGREKLKPRPMTDRELAVRWMSKRRTA